MATYLLNKNNLEKIEIARQQKLVYTHNRAVAQFSNGVEKMAGLVAGMKSYINMSETLPSQEEFQHFVQSQLDDIQSKDSIAITVTDTSHIFRQAFTRYAIDPAKLVGRSVKDFRAQEKIQALEALMETDELVMFPPINLKEGWLGIPINFRIYRNGKVDGYVAPIINFASVMSGVYDEEISRDFVFKFTTERGYELDRTRSYNGTKVYNNNVDEEFYKNFQVLEDSFITTTRTYFDFEISISTAYKKPTRAGENFETILFICFGIFSLGLFIITWQVDRYLALNRKLKVANNEIAIQNKELEQLNQTKNRFFTMISHDVRQPLQSVEGLLAVLQHEKTDDPSLDSLFDGVRKSTRNTVILLNNLLRWALSQTGELNYDPVPLNLSKIMKEVIRLVEQQAAEKSIAIIEKLDEEVFFNGDVDMIKTVFRNLISNAIKFSEENGKVVITSTVQESEIHISIHDDGIGMKPELAASLFQLGEMVSRKGTAGETGTGLGLILCKDFVEKHNGRMEVDSTLGEGTTFTVVLPIDKT